jgi:hypothetical protein
MPFVKRDEDGQIVAVYQQPLQDGLEEVPPEDRGLQMFLDEVLLDYAANRNWIKSDLGLVRVLEDVIEVLIDRGVFMFTDLPDQAQQKLRERHGLRKEFAYIETLFGSEEDELETVETGGSGEDSGERYL